MKNLWEKDNSCTCPCHKGGKCGIVDCGCKNLVIQEYIEPKMLESKPTLLD